MKFKCIVLKDNPISELGFSNLCKSTKHKIERYNAITPEQVYDLLNQENIRWNYPHEGKVFDIPTGLKKTAYSTVVPEKRIACALSHYFLWKTCREPTVILEHDAIFTKDLDFKYSDFDILGINDPRGATRKADLFHKLVQDNPNNFQSVPVIDKMDVPQGLAGNSAYIINPAGAGVMLDLVNAYGLWPNDALMCQQLVPKLGVTRTYYTKVQKLESTTSL